LELAKSILDRNLYEEIKEIVKIKKEGKEETFFDNKEILDFVKNLFDELEDKEKEMSYEKKNEVILFEKINQKAIEIKKNLIC